MRPSEFAATVRSVLVEPARLDERPSQLTFCARLASDGERRRWLALRDQLPNCVDALGIRYSETDVDLEEEYEGDLGELFDVTVEKSVHQEELRIFLSEFVGTIVSSSERSYSCIRVAEMSDEESFETGSSAFDVWTDQPGRLCDPINRSKDPRKFVRDFSGQNFVVEDVSQWIIRNGPVRRGEVFRSWASFAARKLLATLVDYVSAEGQAPFYHLDGPPAHAFQVLDAELEELIDGVMDAAAWIYLEGTDADTRHLFFSSEFARSYRATDLQESIERALDSAKISYSAHAKSASRETLKALAELRKNVVEETRGITQKAQELSTSLWRDLVVAAVPFLIRFLPGGLNLAGTLGLTIISLFAAFFLAFSFVMQVWLNSKYFNQQDASRVVWRQLLSPYLSSKDLEEFSDTPVNESLRVYRRTRLVVGCVYAALFSLLLIFAVSNQSDFGPESGIKKQEEVVEKEDVGGADAVVESVGAEDRSGDQFDLDQNSEQMLVDLNSEPLNGASKTESLIEQSPTSKAPPTP